MIVRHEDWKAFRVAVGDSLIASIVTGADRDRIDYLTRLFRAISLIELLAADALRDGRAETVQRLATFSLVLLPPWLQSARRPEAPLFARAPAFSDLVVVREEWGCYAPGEIAHIENVMKSERKVRTHERMDEVETQQEEETATTNYE